MVFVSENIIESVIESLENADFESAVTVLAAKQPVLLNYLMAEDFELLTQAERELMLYVVLVIYQSVEQAAEQKLPPLSKKAIETTEEKNWEMLDAVTAKKFRDRMTVFFDNYDQEDLLAFVEDTLVEDEDGDVTKEGREPLFVALKTVIDVLTAA
jgi:hypothetical protein